ncbi:hypothetical protein JNW89_32895, partial [Micromonospora sp. 4G55]|nr:hypothetical protein [Micromonospora sp. 4G55]
QEAHGQPPHRPDRRSDHPRRRRPCYTLVDENEREYALHGPEAGELTEGSFVTLRVTPRTDPVDCGPGIPMRIVTG